MNIVFFGLSLTSSWGNGHAVTYRSLIKGLYEEGHAIQFFERDVDWYRGTRDLSEWPYSSTIIYNRLSELAHHRQELRYADAIIIGSYVPDASIIFRMLRSFCNGVIALYDIDTPVTLEDLRAGRPNVFDRAMIASADLYLSFTGGPTLELIHDEFEAPCVRPLYCSVDPDIHRPQHSNWRHQISYLGTYSADRQSRLQAFLFDVAKQQSNASFMIGGAQFPQDIDWPPNIIHREHISPADHSLFYAQSRTTLNLTRMAMRIAGFSPSIRLFEAASCRTAILTDDWPGLSEFFQPDHECIVIHTTEDVIAALQRSDRELTRIAEAALDRTLSAHTGRKRAQELVAALDACVSQRTEKDEPIRALHVE